MIDPFVKNLIIKYHNQGRTIIEIAVITGMPVYKVRDFLQAQSISPSTTNSLLPSPTKTPKTSTKAGTKGTKNSKNSSKANLPVKEYASNNNISINIKASTTGTKSSSSANTTDTSTRATSPHNNNSPRTRASSKATSLRAKNDIAKTRESSEAYENSKDHERREISKTHEASENCETRDTRETRETRKAFTTNSTNTNSTNTTNTNTRSTNSVSTASTNTSTQTNFNKPPSSSLVEQTIELDHGHDLSPQSTNKNTNNSLSASPDHSLKTSLNKPRSKSLDEHYQLICSLLEQTQGNSTEVYRQLTAMGVKTQLRTLQRYCKTIIDDQNASIVQKLMETGDSEAPKAKLINNQSNNDNEQWGVSVTLKANHVITIPKAIRQALKAKAHDELMLIYKNGQVILCKKP